MIASIIERVGPCRLRPSDSGFHALVRSIVSQQLSVKAAATIFARLVAAAGDPLTPEGLLRLSLVELRGLGLSQQKASYITDLAERTHGLELQFDKIRRMPDQRVIEHLTRVKGIGVWTVHMYLIFNLRRPNVLPVGDLGIRNAIKRAYKLEMLPSPEEIQELAQPWHPYCSFASWYLWRSLEFKD